MSNNEHLLHTLEAALFAAGEAISIERLQQLFSEENRPGIKEIKNQLQVIYEHYKGRGVELVNVAGGYRFQVAGEYAQKIKGLWERRPPRHSRAFLETLALIAYRQPITRGEIEDIRGVAISNNIMKTLFEREWIKVVGQRDVPGKPSLLGTTKQFLDDFNLTSLVELPPLPALGDREKVEEEFQPQTELPLESTEELSSVQA